jgi:signal transduction histidine kinase
MRLSLSTRIFLGFAVVVSCFGVASLYGVAAVNSLRHELQFLRTQALPLLESMRKNGVELRAFDEALQRAAPHDLDWVARFVPNARPYKRVDSLRAEFLLVKETATPENLARLISPTPQLPDLDTNLDALRSSTKRRDLIVQDIELMRLLDASKGGMGTDAAVFSLLVRSLQESIAERRLSDAARLVVEIRRSIRQVHRTLGKTERRFERSLNARFAEAERSEQRLGLIVVLSSGVSLAISVVALLAMLATLRPMAELAEVVRRFARGERSIRSKTHGAAEIRQLAVEWNRMADALAERESQISAQREDLARSERLAALGHMAAHMAHEVRNPLSSIGLNAELLSDEIKAGSSFDRDEAGELLASIANEVERLRNVTETHLNRARRAPLTRNRLDLGDLVRRLLDFAHTELDQRKVVTHLDISSEAWAEVDERLVKQALWNLVRNGWEAMPEGGTLWLTVLTRKATDKGDVELVSIMVEDSGQGIAEGVGDHLFEPFFTTKESGTGVGLVLVAEVATSHGGTIEVVSSRHGNGACLELSLPVKAPPTCHRKSLGTTSRRKRREQAPAITPPHQPRIQDSHHAPVALTAYQAAKALPKRGRCQRHTELCKGRVSGRLDAPTTGCKQGLVRRRKWYLVENHEAQGIARQVDPLPEPHRGEQQRRLLADKALEQQRLALLA